MQLNSREDGDFYLIELDGELDASSAVLLDTALSDAVKHRSIILIDCQKLTYISSPGIGVFTSRIDDCQKKKFFMAIFGMKEVVFQVFQILGLDQLLLITDTKDQAIALIHDLQEKSNL